MRSTESFSLCVDGIGMSYVHRQILLPKIVARRINLPVRFEQEMKLLPGKFMYEVCVGECAMLEKKREVSN